MNTHAPLVALTLVALAGGCASSPDSPRESAGQVKQVLRCTAKDGVDAAAVVAVANEFARLPGALDVVAGVDPTGPARPVTSHGNVVTFILTYRNEAAYLDTVQSAAYQNLRDVKLSELCGEVTDTPVTLRQYQVSETFAKATTAADQERRSAAAKTLSEQIRSAK